jgi:hypothetical protein
MTNAERKALRDKHLMRFKDSDGPHFCRRCGDHKSLRDKHFFWKERECNYDGETYPCDVIKVLDYLDVVEPMPQEEVREINWAGGK